MNVAERVRKNRKGYGAVLAILIGLALISVSPTQADHGSGVGQSFLFLEPGFTQEIVGLFNGFVGGVAFAPDGDPWVNDCLGLLTRFDLQGVAPEMHGTKLHPATTATSPVAGFACGMTNHPDGFIYANTLGGVVQIDADTGLPTGRVFGPPGNRFGIATDPQTGDLVYVTGPNCFPGFPGPCNVFTVAPDTGDASLFVALPGIGFIDGIAFEPGGAQLFLANFSGGSVIIVDRNAPGARSGTVNRAIPIPNTPDGIAFHLDGFLVTTNADGTITKIVLGPLDVVSTFASGGGRNDLSQVGPDTCLYTTQDFFTRFDDGTVTADSSLVRICPGFIPPPGVEGDDDGDGVGNGTDICGFTPVGEVVDPGTGCSIAQLNPCEGPRGTTEPWSNHGTYVSSVARGAESFLAQGLITQTEKDVIVAAAAQSTCGEK